MKKKKGFSFTDNNINENKQQYNLKKPCIFFIFTVLFLKMEKQ